MIITGKKHIKLDIWLEILKQAKKIADKIRIINSKEVHYRQKANKSKMCPLLPSSKEIRHVYPLFWYDYQTADLSINFGFNHKFESLYNRKNIIVDGSLPSIGQQ